MDFSTYMLHKNTYNTVSQEGEKWHAARSINQMKPAHKVQHVSETEILWAC